MNLYYETSVPCVNGHPVKDMGLSIITAVEYGMSVADLPIVGVIGEGINSIGEGVDVIHLPQFRIPRKPIGDGDVI